MKVLPAATAAALLFARPLHAQGVQTLYETARPSVVLLKTFDRLGSERGQGTGFFVSDQLVVTNHHVIDGATRVELSGKSIKGVAAESLVVSDSREDLAVIRIPRSNVSPLALALRPAVIGEHVVVVGNPLGFSDTLSEGIVSAIRPHGTAEMEDESPHRGPLLQITAPISPGSSGSPVLDGEGKVLGVAVATWTGGQSLNFAVPAQSVDRLMRSARDKADAVKYSSSRRLLLQNVLLSIAVFGVVIYLFRRHSS